MRWTDLPRDREFVGDADPPPASPSPYPVQRGEWDDLRQRLERLPAGHPSSPDDEGDATDALADDALADAGRADAGRAEEGGAGEGRAVEGDDHPAERDGRTGPDRRGRVDGPAAPGGYEAGRALGLDRREPYQPWFASGESPEPWFSADPYA